MCIFGQLDFGFRTNSHMLFSFRKFENIYIGWGLKKAGAEYGPPLPPPPQKEYPNGPEVTEALDPTPEEEQELNKALEEQQSAQEEMVESEEEEEEDDDEDD